MFTQKTKNRELASKKVAAFILYAPNRIVFNGEVVESSYRARVASVFFAHHLLRQGEWNFRREQLIIGNGGVKINCQASRSDIGHGRWLRMQVRGLPPILLCQIEFRT